MTQQKPTRRADQPRKTGPNERSQNGSGDKRREVEDANRSLEAEFYDTTAEAAGSADKAVGSEAASERAASDHPRTKGANPYSAARIGTPRIQLAGRKSRLTAYGLYVGLFVVVAIFSAVIVLSFG